MPTRRAAIGACALVAAAIAIAAADPLDICFIDVGGGQSTPIVTPAGESLLVDTGYAGNNARDAGRILAAAREAGIRQIGCPLIEHDSGPAR